MSTNAQGSTLAVGIVAHVDAGKTTTTERMLYYTGQIDKVGDVHHGDTVTDFLEMERERGITIASAVVCLPWRVGGYYKGQSQTEGKELSQIYLVDTPGHVDFTLEVERALRVLDGVVVVLDGTKGVEAQTETVWRQADRFLLPRVVFCNKMDREGATFADCLSQVQETFGVPVKAVVVPVQHMGLPLGDTSDAYSSDGGKIESGGKKESDLGSAFSDTSLDVVNGLVLTWLDVEGQEVVAVPVSNAEPALHAAFVEHRIKLVDFLTEVDDDLLQYVLESDQNVASLEPHWCGRLRESVAKATRARKMVPALGGSSFKNRGVQPLLDAMCEYLPQGFCSLADVNFTFKPVKASPSPPVPLGMLCFKVVYDKRYKGLIAFVRVYQGTLEKGQKVQVFSRNGKDLDEMKKNQTVHRVCQVRADAVVDIPSACPGQLVAVMGLEDIQTGDALTSDPESLQHADWMDKVTRVPEPVFFCSLEAPNAAAEKQLQQALTWLLFEDPSVRVVQDPHTGQTLMGGMGELHLCVLHDRLVKHFNVECTLGEMQTTFCMGVGRDIEKRAFVYPGVGGGESTVVLGVQHIGVGGENEVDLSHWEGAQEDVFEKVQAKNQAQKVHGGKGRKDGKGGKGGKGGNENNQGESILVKRETPLAQLVRSTLLAGLGRGISGGRAFSGTRITVHEISPNLCAPREAPAYAGLCSHLSRAVRDLLVDASPVIVEPVMDVVVVCNREHVRAVIHHLSKFPLVQVGEVSVGVEGSEGFAQSTIKAVVPSKSMIGYASELRSVSRGSGSFTMSFAGWIRGSKY